MDVNSQKIEWHLKTLPLNTKKALDFLSLQNWLKESKWYLAGGTALALFAGHRKSLDLDFFNTQKNIDNDDLLNNFLENKEWNTNLNKKNTIYGELFTAKVSFIAYPFFVPKQDYLWYGLIKVLAPKDIAVMKIIAISQRGRKRDFFDLFWLVHNIEPLENIILKLKEQYPSVAHDYHHILKSLVYFNDAETDPDPEIYFEAKWKEVKRFFKKEIPIIAKKIMNLD
ncbi:nucleotidyl transferase AbiEii/AbiGii toxin family protein [Patescibacteria group bacterium]|nr:nucleotidyl transferase AbiEii/AbiGii toxin family protein [Patescibacteria group bacterium]MBU4367271.1 nucleotidyl transferase AbiEii/AbiGii toxin family protein [Patescibacteria group bacterium]MBU4462012.1 nucleotidyl transferase AbiEii/AbiGii toxin family protein [Patescibacteria group bacterium]MCG2700203.1 nucleotidyl transferase AbiEii/AbiGii toxin family protein [Candidatus Parcubacteria bacterium]